MQRSKTAERQGSAMSTRQVAYAAVAGREIIFRFVSIQPPYEVRGYVVGKDDYHWMVASVDPAMPDSIIICLVHKAGPEVIVLACDHTLVDESLTVQVALQDIGGAFWDWCAATYFVHRPARSDPSRPPDEPSLRRSLAC